MPKYKIKGTDILHSKVIYVEGKEIELTKEEALPLADYLELIPGTENETIKQEEVKQAKPARVTKAKPKAVKDEEASIQTPKEPVAQAEVANIPATSEAKPQSNTQVSPASQKVIANAITQVNNNVHKTPAQGKTNYQPSAPPNMRSA